MNTVMAILENEGFITFASVAVYIAMLVMLCEGVWW
jgi:hypothetical protein